jgi:peptidoglycan hydrolase-like protein with peptidoglycan-binding domain
MSRLLGFGLIVTGVLIGGVAVPLSASSIAGRDVQLATATVLPGQAATDKASAPELPAFAVPALRPLPSAVAAAPGMRDDAQRTITQPLPSVRALPVPGARKPIVPPFETVTMPHDPAAITRAVQTELTRVGCYAGPVTGFWGPDTRRAMKAFTNRVNATLPVNKPDVILLSLLQAEPAGVCAKACPAGQEGAADGRCVPKAVLAQAARKAHPTLAKAAVPAAHEPAAPKAEVLPHVVASAPASALLPPVFNDPQRMALAGPTAEDHVSTAAAPTTPEKPAPVKHAKKRERKEPTPSARYGQTKWARDFFRNAATF